MKRKYKFWTEQETNYLIENFHNKKNKELSLFLDRSIGSIVPYASKLGLKKSKKHKSKLTSIQNKLNGRDLTLKKLEEIAKNYKTRGQFQLFDPSAYTTARKTIHMNNICSHMIKSTSIPQLIMTFIVKEIFKCEINVNDRTKIKPYELDIYIKNYNIAFEYDGKLWHKNNKNDKIKNKMCKEENILLVRISETSRNYITDIKTQLKSKIEIINKYAELSINENDIEIVNNIKINDFINSQILDKDDIEKVISKYTHYNDFKINESKLYRKLSNRKLVNKYLCNLDRDRIYWNDIKINDEINKYENLCDFIKNSHGCYIYCKRHNIDLSKLKRKNINLSIEIIKKESHNYDRLCDFKKDFPKYYAYIKRHKKWDIIKHLKRY